MRHVFALLLEVRGDIERDPGHPELPQSDIRPIQSAGPGRPDENLGQGQRARRERLVGHGQQQISGPVMMDVRRVEMGDQDTGVQHDHSGQSSRSWVR